MTSPLTKDLVVRTPLMSTRLAPRAMLVQAVIVTLCVGLALASINLGSYEVSPREVFGVLIGAEDGLLRMVVLEWRLPRIVAAVLFGALLGISGAVFQSLTRNPLGSPDIIGFNSGAFSGVVVALLFGALSYAALTVGAIIGGLITAAVVYAVSFRRGVSGFRFIIVGIAVGAFLSSMNSWFSVRADVDSALRAAVWGAGSLGLATWTTLGVAAGIAAVVAVVTPMAQRSLELLELGDDAASALGLPAEWSKVGLIVLGTLTTAAVTASAGPIAFVALAAPHIARRLAGRGSSVDLLSSAAVGALLLLVSDTIAQYAIPGASLPVGAVTVSLGGVYLIYLLIIEARR